MKFKEIIAKIEPGESVRVCFPQGFILDYKTWSNGGYVTKSFECSELHVYHWDDDDHWCVDWYFHENEKNHWTCKLRSLTDESRDKVFKYLRENGTK